MKSKIIYFIAGFFVCFIAMMFVWDLKKPYKTRYSFADTKKSNRFAIYLDNRKIPYSYIIDHLKRHWVKPHINEDKENKIIKEDFEKHELLRDKGSISKLHK